MKLTNAFTTIDRCKLSQEASIQTRASGLADFTGHLDKGAAADIRVRVERNFDISQVGSLDEQSVARDLLNLADDANGLARILGEHGGVDEGGRLVHFGESQVFVSMPLLDGVSRIRMMR